MSTAIPATPPASFERIPELQPGDRLTRSEFERRYAAMPSDSSAELVEGTVYMTPPVSHDHHGRPHFSFVGWLFTYQATTPGIDGGDNSTIRLDLDNEPQPDAFLRILPEFGGQTRNSAEFIDGAPELVAEIAASSVSYDLHDKLQAYRRNGVCEYIVWRVRDNAVDWFALREGRFVSLPVSDDGIIRSEVFPGLWLDVEALLSGDMARVLQIAQEGLGSQEYVQFRQHLKSRRIESVE